MNIEEKAKAIAENWVYGTDMKGRIPDDMWNLLVMEIVNGLIDARAEGEAIAYREARRKYNV